jgi:hypothetical protein
VKNDSKKLAKVLLDAAEEGESPKDFLKRHAANRRELQAKNVRVFPLGTICHGTLDTDYLVKRFLDAIEWADPPEAARLRKENADVIDLGQHPDDDLAEQQSYFLNETLWDVMNEYCPAYTYFGSNEGDGSDFGVWISSESLEDDIQSGAVALFEPPTPEYQAWSEDGTVPDKEAVDDAEYVLFRRDYRMSLYDATTKKEVWSI